MPKPGIMENNWLLLQVRIALLDLLRASDILEKAQADNPWFTIPMIREAIEAMLPWAQTKLPSGMQTMHLSDKKTGLIMAGNLPLVGLHDLIVVLMAGQTAIVKPSSKDQVLMSYIIEKLNRRFFNRIHLQNEIKPTEIDFLIATGSNNTARYLEYHFESVPKVLRKNRYSVAILRGNESEDDLVGVSKDILTFHGMGCRSVSNLLLPSGYQLEPLIASLAKFPVSHFSPNWQKILQWELAVEAVLGKVEERESPVVLKAAGELGPVAIGHVRLVYYSSVEELNEILSSKEQEIQCRVGPDYEVPFGQSQCPEFLDFADGVNTWELLNQL